MNVKRRESVIALVGLKQIMATEKEQKDADLKQVQAIQKDPTFIMLLKFLQKIPYAEKNKTGVI